MTKIQKFLIVTMLVAAFGIGFYEARRASLLQTQVQDMQFQQDSLSNQLQKERDASANALTATPHQRGETLDERLELLRLRAEVAKLKSASRELAQLKTAVASKDNDPTTLAIMSWVDRVKQLSDRLEQTPARKIPEFQFLTDQDWFNAVGKIGQNATDADYDKAISDLRTSAKNEFAGAVQGALHTYAQSNNGQAPSDISQLQPYFASPLDDSILQRYQLGQSGAVTEVVAPQDEQNDAYYQITQNSINSSSKEEDMLQPAVDAFAAANSGQMPSDPSKLLPYVKTPAEQAALQNLMQKPASR